MDLNLFLALSFSLLWRRELLLAGRISWGKKYSRQSPWWVYKYLISHHKHKEKKNQCVRCVSKCQNVFMYSLSVFPFFGIIYYLFFFWIDLLWLCLSHTNCILFSIHASSYSFGSCAVSTSRLQLTFETGHTSRLTDFGLFEGLFTKCWLEHNFPTPLPMICHCSLDNSPGLYIYFGNITARSVRSCRSLLRSPLPPLFIVPHSERRSPIGPFRLGDSESDEMKGHDLSGSAGSLGSPKTAGHAVMAGLA